MGRCRYRNAGGAPRTGMHAARIPLLDLALWDVVGTLVAAGILAYALNVNAVWTALALLVLGTALHLVFCVRTTITQLFSSPLD